MNVRLRLNTRLRVPSVDEGGSVDAGEAVVEAAVTGAVVELAITGAAVELAVMLGVVVGAVVGATVVVFVPTKTKFSFF